MESPPIYTGRFGQFIKHNHCLIDGFRGFIMHFHVDFDQPRRDGRVDIDRVHPQRAVIELDDRGGRFGIDDGEVVVLDESVGRNVSLGGDVELGDASGIAVTAEEIPAVLVMFDMCKLIHVFHLLERCRSLNVGLAVKSDVGAIVALVLVGVNPAPPRLTRWCWTASEKWLKNTVFVTIQPC